MSGPDKDLDELERRFHEGAPARSDAPLQQSDAAPGEGSEDEARELRGTFLAQRLRRRRGYGIPAREPKVRRLFSSWALGALAAVALFSLWSMAPELRYFLSGAPATDLGHLGAYHPESAPDGAFVHAQGIASPRRGTFSRMFAEHELFPLVGSRILVDRARPPDESLRGFGFRWEGAGRLVRAQEGSRWQAVREQFVQAGELAREGEVYVIEEGVSPRTGLRIPGEALLWGCLATTCLAVLFRRLLRRRTQSLR